MKRPKQMPAVDRNSNKSASVPVAAGVGPSDAPRYKFVGKQPSPACKAVADRGCCA